MTFQDYIFLYGSVFSPLIPLGFVMKKLRRTEKVILLFIVISFLSDYISTFAIIGQNYLFLHGYGLLEALVLFWFFYLVLDSKKWIPYLAMIYSSFYLVNSLEFEASQFNTIARSIECLIIIFLSLRLFYQFFRQEEDIFIERSPLFWINVGLLIYFSGAFFTFIFSEYILDPREVPMWRLHNSANFLKNVFLAIGLWRAR